MNNKIIIIKKKKGEGGRRTTMEKIDQTRVHWMHIWRCHKETPYKYYTLIKMFKTYL
jgi:hypothetical protein